MKFLFIVQGEGRGHLTQAITLEEMLLRNGHEVVEVLVGESSSRILPGFFNRNIQAPVKRFISPNFLSDTNTCFYIRILNFRIKTLLNCGCCVSSPR